MKRAIQNTLAVLAVLGTPISGFAIGLSDYVEHFAGEIDADSVHFADLDNDGDMDILTASFIASEIAWFENLDGHGAFGGKRSISFDALWARSVFAADIDGDGDLDALSASMLDDKIAWYENLDGRGAFGPPSTITNQAIGAVAVRAADIDGDLDMDVLSASRLDGKIAWYENLDGNGNFGEQIVVSLEASAAADVTTADIDGDGDLDLISASEDDGKIAWYENLDGMGAYGAQHVVTTLAEGAVAVDSADFDGDGDVDIVAASKIDQKVAWFENRDGAGSFGAQKIVSLRKKIPSAVLAVDLDADGDFDIVSAGQRAGTLAWHENRDGAGNFGDEAVIARSPFGITAFDTGDIDGDGDFDLVALAADPTLHWYETELKREVSIGDTVLAEGESNPVLGVVLDQALIYDLVLQYETVNGTAIEGDDYSRAFSEIVIPPGAVFLEFASAITITDDDELESFESFSLVLSNPLINGHRHAVFLAKDTASIGIIDNDGSIDTVPFDDWAASHGLEGEQATFDADSDGDRLPLLVEYAFNFDPNQADDGIYDPEEDPGEEQPRGLPKIEVVKDGSGNSRLRIHFIRRRTETDPLISYIPEFTSSRNWTNITAGQVVEPIDDTWERVSIDDPVTSNIVIQRLARIRLVYSSNR